MTRKKPNPIIITLGHTKSSSIDWTNWHERCKAKLGKIIVPIKEQIGYDDLMALGYQDAAVSFHNRANGYD